MLNNCLNPDHTPPEPDSLGLNETKSLFHFNLKMFY